MACLPYIHGLVKGITPASLFSLFYSLHHVMLLLGVKGNIVCFRSYKSGYVWYDLGVNDIIHPADGAEYVLKGSELLQGCTGTYSLLQDSSLSIIMAQHDPI